jgi:hypothetical protein
LQLFYRPFGTQTIDPPFKDRFHEVQELIFAFNENMAENFMPAWINCIDESMLVWFSEYTCPGWMFVPRKPRPFGNEYHTACCGNGGILWALELVEGKDRPWQLDKPDFINLGKTVGLLLCLTRPIWNTGWVVIIAMKKRCVWISLDKKNFATGPNILMVMESISILRIKRLVMLMRFLVLWMVKNFIYLQ